MAKTLGKRGPHRVLRGDLALAGQPGVVYTPESGYNLPAVAFGHDWMTSVARYSKTFEHLASWGIVVAAPDSERGLVPSHRGLAADLRATLDICVGVRLGPGNISVQPSKVAFAGHGMGASAAVLAARSRDVGAVAALFPARTAPPAESVAAQLDAPGLVVSGMGEDAGDSEPRAIARAWHGDVVLRQVDGGTSSQFVEGLRVVSALGVPGKDRAVQRTTRALLTGFLLYHLAGDNAYEPFADDSELPGTTVVDPDAEQDSGSTDAKSLLAHSSQLLGRK
nr:hypothetical protein [Rhodococcus sp. HNM0569]